MRNKNKTTTAKEESQPALVPKLRFPEFLREKEWKEHSLGSVCSFFSGGTPSTSKPDYYGGNIPFIRSAEIARDRTELNLTPEGLANSAAKIVTKGDVLIALYGANSGEVALSKIDGAINQAVLCLKCKWSNAFVFYYLNFMKDFIVATYLQGGQGNLSGEIIKSIVVGFPSLPEQQKIAACLSSVDKLIAAQARKVEALKVHKKGLMQQLFPREGETQPRLRFPEFRGKGEWEERVLGAMTNRVGSGITPTGGENNYKQIGRPFVRSQNVGWGILLLDDIVFIDEKTHSSFIATEIHACDVLLNITGASIGRSAVADSTIAGGNVNQHVCIIRVKEEELNPVYLNQYLISPPGQNQIDSFQAGGNRQGLNFAQIRSFSIPLPPMISEQRRIASCLSSLDALVNAESQKLETLKMHKKGLMQGLFPAREDA